MATTKPFRILALAGGGYLGLYTATVLAALEERCGVPLGQRFDLIAGTSVGGILAVALAYEVPMPGSSTCSSSTAAKSSPGAACRAARSGACST